MCIFYMSVSLTILLMVMVTLLQQQVWTVFWSSCSLYVERQRSRRYKELEVSQLPNPHAWLIFHPLLNASPVCIWTYNEGTLRLFAWFLINVIISALSSLGFCSVELMNLVQYEAIEFASLCVYKLWRTLVLSVNGHFTSSMQTETFFLVVTEILGSSQDQEWKWEK